MPDEPREPTKELPGHEKEMLPLWPGPGPKHGLPFKIFPRDWTAEQIHEWMVKQGWVKDRRGEAALDEPTTDERQSDEKPIEEPPELTPEDEEILDRIWDELDESA